ncbi:ABC-2 family transporter protein [Bdellovibrio sp. HCB2-146]|uniref:ABC-2 family transporter protein n=1 Tax=Bdellovibrio sp. HCB2-146 TaxID=3394362 RepID=UPI0039BD28C7
MTVLLLKAFKHNWSAQASNKVNLWAAMITMIVNNVFFLYGMWLMLFDGKAQNKPLFPYYLTMTALAYVAWGSLNFFLGGLREMGEMIDSGKLEPMMGTPRSPLLLVAISQSSATALGDLLQGVVTLIALFWLCDIEWVLRAIFASVVVVIGFAAIFIAAGTLAFFVNRGAQLSFFIIESTLSFTMYPVTKILDGPSRMLLYVIPAAITATLPMTWIEETGWIHFAEMMICTSLVFLLSIVFFNTGLKRYRAASFVSTR